MVELCEPLIAGKILQMLTSDVILRRLKPEWLSTAHKYVRQCLMLYEQGQGQQSTTVRQRRECFYRFWGLLQMLGDKDPKKLKMGELLSDCWPSEANKVGDDTMVVSLQILSQQEQDYLRAIKVYVCEKIKTLFADSVNLHFTIDGQSSKMARLADYLDEPFILTMNEVRVLIQFIRSLPIDDRNRVEDIRHLVMFWQKVPEVVKTGKEKEVGEMLINLAQRQREDLYDLIFDLIYMYSTSSEYCESVVSRLARVCANECKNLTNTTLSNIIKCYSDLTEGIIGATGDSTRQWLSRFREHMVSELKIIFREVKTTEDRQQLVGIALALFPENAEKCFCFNLLQETEKITNLDVPKWREVIFTVCESDTPRDKTKKYLYVLLSYLIDITEEAVNTSKLIEEKTNHKMPSDISTVITACKELVFDLEYIEVVLNKLIRRVDTNNSMSKYYHCYINRALWLCELFKETDKARKAAEEMSKYWVIRGLDKDQDYYRIHAKIVLRLLCSSNYPKVEFTILKKEIEELHNNDTLNCPVETSQMSEEVIKDKTAWNFKVCRGVINILDGYVKADNYVKADEETLKCNKYGERTGLTDDEFKRLRKK